MNNEKIKEREKELFTNRIKKKNSVLSFPLTKRNSKKLLLHPNSLSYQRKTKFSELKCLDRLYIKAPHKKHSNKNSIVSIASTCPSIQRQSCLSCDISPLSLRFRINSIVNDVKDDNKNKGKSKFVVKEKKRKVFSSCGNLTQIVKTNSLLNSPNPLLTNSLSMNKFIINGYGFNKVKNTNTKRMIKVSKNYHHFMESMKQTQNEIKAKNFELIKNSENPNDLPYFANNIMSEIKTEKWKKKFLVEYLRTTNKMTNKEFKEFKENYSVFQTLKAKQNSQKFTQLIFDMDSDEYNNRMISCEGTDVNFNNLSRSIRLYKIMKTGEDEEREGNIVGNADFLRKEKNDLNNKMEVALKDIGPPKYLKRKFKKDTVDKYKAVCGEYFGVPV